MHVLISIQQAVEQWQIPEASARALIARFPDIRFTYARSEDERVAALESCEVAYTWRLTPGELARARRLAWVHTSAVALETLCLPELVARGVRVSNTRGVQAVPVAEHALAVLFAFAKQLPFSLANQEEARWAQHEYIGRRLPWLLSGRTLGLVGVGSIGAALAVRAAALGMRVIALRRRLDGPEVPGVSASFDQSGLAGMLSQCDALVVAAPLTPLTDRLLDRTAFSALKPGAVLINVGRARIVDTDALIDALRDGRLAGASLDVFPEEPLPPAHPLWSCPNVILTPHTSGFRHGHWDEVVEVFADNLTRFQRGEALQYEVSGERGY